MNPDRPPWLTVSEWIDYLDRFGLLRKMHQEALAEMRDVCVERHMHQITSQMKLVTLDQAAELQRMVYGG